VLSVSNLQMTYRGAQGTVDAVKDVSFEVGPGEFFALLGPSGSGKTSTLRCVAGLETPDSGTIKAKELVLFDGATKVNLPAFRRGLGMVFQSYAIWPHMSVYDNVAFPLQHGVKKLSKQQVKTKVMEVLALVQLDQVANRPAPYLSGGQQQRVALARALALEPAVLLLDEPLSNLDAKLREEMRQEIKSLVKRTGTTTLYVTHDQLEALTMADRIALMHQGRIDQQGEPKVVYQNPATPFAAHFLGRTNILEGTVLRARNGTGTGSVHTDWGTVEAPLPAELREGSPVAIGFRPESIVLEATAPVEGSTNVLQGKVSRRTFAGDMLELEIDLGGRTLRARADPYLPSGEGSTVFVRIPADRCYYLSGTSAHRDSSETAAPEANTVGQPWLPVR